MYLTEFYKTLYEQENNVRKTCEDRLPFDFTILATTATLLVFSMNNTIILTESQSIWNKIFNILILIAFAIFVGQIIFMFKTYFSFKYKYLSFPINKIEEKIRYRIQLVGEKFTTKESLEKYISEYIDGMVCRVYMKCASNNYVINMKKRKAQHMLSMLSYFNMILLAMLYLIIIFQLK